MAPYAYAVYYGVFIQLPRQPDEPATATSPPKHRLSINHGALWVSQADGKIKGFDWTVKDEEGLAGLIKRMGWRVEIQDQGSVGGVGELVTIVKARAKRNGFFFPGFIGMLMLFLLCIHALKFGCILTIPSRLPHPCTPVSQLWHIRVFHSPGLARNIHLSTGILLRQQG